MMLNPFKVVSIIFLLLNFSQITPVRSSPMISTLINSVNLTVFMERIVREHFSTEQTTTAPTNYLILLSNFTGNNETVDDDDVIIFHLNTPTIMTDVNNFNHDSTIKAPQSFTIFMSFQDDGTTGLQILNRNNLYWSDAGNCRHGQIFDPFTGICRDVFCNDGFVQTQDGCVPDENVDRSHLEPVKKPAEEMEVEITLNHQLCTFVRGINSTSECNHETAINPGEDLEQEIFLDEFRKNISEILHINPERIQDMSVESYKVVNESHATTVPILNQTEDIKPLDLLLGYRFIDSVIMTEELKLRFIIKNNSLFEDDTKQTILLFYYLTLLSLEMTTIPINNHYPVLTNVVEIRNATDGWCNGPGDEKLYVRSDFRIYALYAKDKNTKYYIYVNQTETLYATGYYYLTMFFVKDSLNLPGNDRMSEFKENNTVSHSSTQIKSEFKNDMLIIDNDLDELLDDLDEQFLINDRLDEFLLDLVDVTDSLFDNKTSKLLTVCNRAPRIRVNCKNHETVRLKICELDKQPDRSYCVIMFPNVCYSINEYAYDSLEPDVYIRVCKEQETVTSNSVNKTNSLLVKNDYVKKRPSSEKTIIEVSAGWLSLVTTVVSLIAMIATLITYFMFKELRNIPGWNVINLIIALVVGQSCFLIGSTANQTPVACFIIALFTHYGYLASFFWMNVIAFDLYRNFRQKSSHILLQSLDITKRLKNYVLFAWLSPLTIIITAVIVDFTVNDDDKPLSYQPCYAGLAPGCDKTKNNFSNSSANGNETCIQPNVVSSVSRVLVLEGACWIRNGLANLIFFGLPIAFIISVNAVFYSLAIYNIRKKKQKQKDTQLRRISRARQPLDADIRFYVQIAVIMGFSWSIGFFLHFFNTTHDRVKEIIYYILTYAFILLNASVGLFIFFVFIFKTDIWLLYKREFQNRNFHFLTRVKTTFRKRFEFKRKDKKKFEIDNNLGGSKFTASDSNMSSITTESFKYYTTINHKEKLENKDSVSTVSSILNDSGIENNSPTPTLSKEVEMNFF